MANVLLQNIALGITMKPRVNHERRNIETVYNRVTHIRS